MVNITHSFYTKVLKKSISEIFKQPYGPVHRKIDNNNVKFQMIGKLMPIRCTPRNPEAKLPAIWIPEQINTQTQHRFIQTDVNLNSQ